MTLFGKRIALTALMVVSLNFIAPAQTVWVVDASNGPGTNFTDLAPAVSAAADGDIVLVHAGIYPGFTLTGKGLTILGINDVIIYGWPNVTLQQTSSTQPIVLSRMSIAPQYSTGTELRVNQCLGPVLLDSLIISAGIEVQSSTDVRARFVQTVARDTIIAGSRFEDVSGNHVGFNAHTDNWPPPAADGGTGFTATGSWIHLAGSICRGGYGGNTNYYPYHCYEAPGDGGIGLSLSTNSFALCSRGSRGAIRGGIGGTEPSGYFAGSGGAGAYIEAASELRISGGVVLDGGPEDPYGGSCSGAGAQYTGSGLLNAVSPREPVLELLNRPFNGGPIRVRLYAPVGASANLLIGNDMSITPTVGVLVPLLTTVQQTVPLGLVPASEFLIHNLFVGPQQLGDLVVVQAEITLPAGPPLRSNSLPIVYR